MGKQIQQKNKLAIFGGVSRNDMEAYFYESGFPKKNKKKIVDYLLCYLIYASSRSPLKTHKTVCTHRERHTHTWDLILKALYTFSKKFNIYYLRYLYVIHIK